MYCNFNPATLPEFITGSLTLKSQSYDSPVVVLCFASFNGTDSISSGGLDVTICVKIEQHHKTVNEVNFTFYQYQCVPLRGKDFHLKNCSFNFLVNSKN